MREGNEYEFQDFKVKVGSVFGKLLESLFESMEGIF